MSLGGLALAIGVLVDAAIVMVENGYRHRVRSIRSTILSPVPTMCASRASDQCRKAGWTGAFLLIADHRRFVPAGISAGSSGGPDVSPSRLDQDARGWLVRRFLPSRLVPVLMTAVHPWPPAAENAPIRCPVSRRLSICRSCGFACSHRWLTLCVESRFPGGDPAPALRS